MKEKAHIDHLKEELKNSPLRSERKGKKSFDVPDDYFRTMEDDILSNLKLTSQPAKVIFLKQVLKISVAASVAAVMVFLGIQFFEENAVEPQFVSRPREVMVDSLPEINSTDRQEKIEELVVVEEVEIKKADEDLEPESSSGKSSIPESNQVLVQNNRESASGEKNIQKNGEDLPLPSQEKVSSSDNNQLYEQNEMLASSSLLPSRVVAENNGAQQKNNIPCALARLSKNRTSNIFLPHDTCVNNAFVYKVNYVQDSVQTVIFRWNGNVLSDHFLVEKSGRYILEYGVADQVYGVDTMIVTLVETPKPKLEPYLEMCSHESILLNSGLSGAVYDHTWSVSSFNTPEILIESFDPGSHEVQLIVTTCVDTVSTHVQLLVNDCKIFIPNVITPNGDGKNDVFVVKGLNEYPGSSLVVFDKSGKLVFQSLDYKNDWTPENLPDGTYFYSLRLNDKKGTEKGGVLTIITR